MTTDSSNRSCGRLCAYFWTMAPAAGHSDVTRDQRGSTGSILTNYPDSFGAPTSRAERTLFE
jgi:hypothetical protein